MQNKKEIRWRQRFDNFQHAYKLLESHIDVDTSDELARAGLIQFFEMAFELAWKLMTDYLEAQGYQVKSPKDALKLAFQAEIIEEGQVWLDALEDRNLTVHTYDEGTANTIAESIKERYFPALHRLYVYMQKKAQS